MEPEAAKTIPSFYYGHSLHLIQNKISFPTNTNANLKLVAIHYPQPCPTYFVNKIRIPHNSL